MYFNSNERSNYSDIHLLPCYCSIQRFVTNKLQVIKEKLTPQQCCCKNARRNLHPRFRTSIDTIYRRKLLSHKHKRPMRRRKSNSMHRKTIAAELKERRRNVAAAKKTASMSDKNTNLSTWDDWNNWSACSVTCGQGRQVRWRHCLSENCSEGLKKAQMRSCRIKDCETKGLLGWLGIKS
ncbi:A disintegrin and metalloproteinase with thrombospondin motifs adt-2 [Odontomachus brunneus]|uniref:A disintegrin and metalloproteinase with thrombospondin motifs adt-2 n=1 Tax=Odontomachus brunneus TaxID=486640 RepID=UPI0013F29064|nr:A disintegrin and metalloproteinase with thrombospondin motifs adt-2 [Odontomachus brunneus]